MTTVNPFDEQNYTGNNTQDLNADIAGILAIIGGMAGLHEYYRGEHKAAYIRFFINFTGIGIIINLIRLIIDIYSIGSGTWQLGLPAAEWLLYPFRILKAFILVLLIAAMVGGGFLAISTLVVGTTNAKYNKMSAAMSELSQYTYSQQAYFSANEELGNWRDISFRPSAKSFAFAEHPEYYSAVAQVKEDLGDCPAGTRISVYAYTEGSWRKKIKFNCKIESKNESACMEIIQHAGGLPYNCNK